MRPSRLVSGLFAILAGPLQLRAMDLVEVAQMPCREKSEGDMRRYVASRHCGVVPARLIFKIFCSESIKRDEMGWLTVLDYVLAFVLTGLAAAKDSRNAGFWATACLFMLLLGGGKAMNIEPLVADMLRDVARHGGWYEVRRPYQEIIIALVAVSALAVGLALGFRKRRARWEVKLAGFALVALATFLGVESASLHAIDAKLHIRIIGFSATGLAKNAFILLVAASAASVVGWLVSGSRGRKHHRRKRP